MNGADTKRSRWAVLVACACAVLALLFFAARESPLLSAAVPAVQSSDDPSPLGEVRYKVPVSMSQPTRGPADALVTIVEWCDLRGAACRQSEASLAKLREQYGERIRHVWRHLPEASEASTLTHEFAHLTFEQAGKFWELRDRLLARTELPSRPELDVLAAELGLDLKSVATQLERHGHAGYVAADGLFAARFGVTSGPTYFVNGVRLEGQPTRERLQRLIERELQHAEALVNAGVVPAQVYDQVTQEGLWELPGNQVSKAQ